MENNSTLVVFKRESQSEWPVHQLPSRKAEERREPFIPTGPISKLTFFYKKLLPLRMYLLSESA